MKFIDSKKKPAFFRFARKIYTFFYRPRKFEGVENMPETPSLYIANHSQAHGPIIMELFFPKKKLIWCIGQMMHKKEVPAYAYQDFWSMKPKGTRWFYKLAAKLIAGPASYFLGHADTIGVYKDARIMNTFKETVISIHDENNIVIFPEGREKYNNIVNEFQNKFIDVARLYYSKYHECISFVPTYICPKLKKVVFGKPIAYNPQMEISEQREVISKYLKEEITKMAQELPKHVVVPYDNIPKKLYPKSK